MITDDLKLIDDTIALIRVKDDAESSFPKEILYTFEVKFFLCLDIARFELQINKRISDLTADALSILFTFQCFEYYFRDFPTVYSNCSELGYALRNYNEKWKNHDLKGKVGVENKKWIIFFNNAISNLLLQTKATQ